MSLTFRKSKAFIFIWHPSCDLNNENKKAKLAETMEKFQIYSYFNYACIF